ncbi:MAG: Signal recognition particle protein [Alphaproteobacteria bacterium MarineAlpha5_Bin11]|nr:signal recognition particle protein [Pelagibacteraceae bacterium]PPR44004.1 MAG: Signal recognition particle protein [Alphaproteobacteria bacterium MarineAlpha5_Bin11]PPR51225.1 MAG: Signal recognition particle protein [Alphaproteobacteria bacterium MarineAlpha5_Bin10]|tara:strand:+ start:5783 stop:7147 length:1365 start_codon:yes stop_codon:yes gene_type:complete
MFASLSQRFDGIISSIRGKALISEDDLEATLRDIRVALLEADVALIVVKKFIENVRHKIIGQNVLKSVKPEHMIIKLVHDELVEILGSTKSDMDFKTEPPAIILFYGLQGSGKTTSIAKVANLISKKNKKKSLLVSTDINRPAAQEQLEVLANLINLDFVKSSTSDSINNIVNNAIKKAKNEFYDLLFIDTAGRQVIDEKMMDELKLITSIANPIEKILVADSLIGQDSANIAKKFKDTIGVSGIILTRIDGDGRGGAALSIKSITGAPIKYLCTGEKIEAIEEFYPDRIANRILGMGDIVGLVEKASEDIKDEEIEKIKTNLEKGKFDLSDFAQQLKKLKKIGGLEGMLSMIPGITGAQKAIAEKKINDDSVDRQLAIIGSMTKKEKESPEIIKASRKIRISNGSGTKVQEVNKLLKQFLQSQKMMKKMKKMGDKKMPFDLMGKLKGGQPPYL